MRPHAGYVPVFKRDLSFITNSCFDLILAGRGGENPQNLRTSSYFPPEKSLSLDLCNNIIRGWVQRTPPGPVNGGIPMALKQLLPTNREEREERYLKILSASESGSWILELPPRLRPHQPELETMLGRVFPQSLTAPENVALAKQLSLNWCMSKARNQGMDIDDCWQEAI